MTLVMGLVGVIGLPIVSAAMVADLVGSRRVGRQYRRRLAELRLRDIDPRTRARLTGLAGRGNKIQAIKDLREVTGLGRRQAKYAVDAIAAGRDH
jgi:hypothetical protein